MFRMSWPHTLHVYSFMVSYRCEGLYEWMEMSSAKKSPSATGLKMLSRKDASDRVLNTSYALALAKHSVMVCSAVVQ